jgi:hypothetical protein
MTNMVFRYLDGVSGGGLLITVHTNRSPSEAEWDAYFRELVKHDPKTLKSLNFTDGAAPNGAQRKQVNDFLQGRTSRCAVVTASPFVRGAVTALSWFNSEIKAYAPDNADAALEYLDVRSQELMLVRREIQLLRKRMGHDDLRSIAAV